MRNLLPLILFCSQILYTGQVKATEQVGDILIYEGDTMDLFSNPLEMYSGADSLRSKWFGNQNNFINTACWRGYVAEWRIIENHLYLSNIFTCQFNDDSTKANLGDFFALTPEGYVQADWFSGTLYIPEGRLIQYAHSGYDGIFEFEKMIVIRNGKLTDSYRYDNSKSFQSPYEADWPLLNKHINSSIQWDQFPLTEKEEIRVYVRIISGDSPANFKLELAKGATDPRYGEEALRVLRTIPTWSVYYKHGEPTPYIFITPVIFSNKNKALYSKNK